MKLKKLVIAAAAAVMAAGMVMTSYAAITFEDWYFLNYGYYPSGTESDWYNTSEYNAYLNEYNNYDYYDYYYDDYDYYYDYEDTSKYYAYVTDAYWSSRTAKWTIEGTASKYQVKLYRDDKCIATQDTKYKSYSFSSYMDKAGWYYFKVKAYNKNAKLWSDWYESDENYFSAYSTTSTTSTTTTAVSNSGGPGSQWIQATDGTGRWWFKHADGGYTKSGWEYIGNKWYYFDEVGWMKTGWLQTTTGMYYLGADGAMLTGYQVIDGVGHNFSPDGAMIY